VTEPTVPGPIEYERDGKRWILTAERLADDDDGNTVHRDAEPVDMALVMLQCSDVRDAVSEAFKPLLNWAQGNGYVLPSDAMGVPMLQELMALPAGSSNAQLVADAYARGLADGAERERGAAVNAHLRSQPPTSKAGER
jgi:hypothetical protein